MNRDVKKGSLFLLGAAFFYSIMPVLIRTLESNGIPPVSQVFLRYIFAFISAVIYHFIIARLRFVRPNNKIMLLLFATIFGYGLTNLFYTIAVLNTQVSNALFLFFTFAIMAPILGFIFLKEKVNKFNTSALILSLIALLLLFQPNGLSTWKIGGIFALMSAFTQASYLIARKRLKEYSASFMMLANTFFGVLALGILSLIFESNFYFGGSINHLSVSTWITTILFGVLNFLGWFCATKGFEYFRSSSASIILLSELVFGVFFALIFFKEVPTYLTLIGGLLIIISSAVVILRGES
ncbi:MAG TPA: DMT family transporter [Candidatus Saccharimonadales bacterium]|nr:DMT family transporter [Candidatus Saccharimonadales bacterium]